MLAGVAPPAYNRGESDARHLEATLVEVTRSAGIELTYSKELLPRKDAEDGITLQATSIGVGDALEQVLRGTGLDVLVSEERMAGPGATAGTAGHADAAGATDRDD